MDPSGENFAVCKGKDFQMFRLDNTELLQTFAGKSTLVRFPKDAVFAEGGTKLVGGTDRGMAILYEVQSGVEVQTLDYGKGGAGAAGSSASQDLVIALQRI